MGNSLKISPCFINTSSRSSNKVKLIFYEGTTTTLTIKKHMIAGEIMFQNPDKILCDADSFFIGQPIPSLSIDHEITPGHTYFLLPIDKFSNNCVVSASSLSLFSSNSNSNSPIKFGNNNNCPFQYIKGDNNYNNGRVLIKVLPEFIIGLIMNNRDLISTNDVCSTPELKKHYDQLVRSKDHTWSPKLQTISEKKIRYSPCRLLSNLEWKQKEI